MKKVLRSKTAVRAEKNRRKASVKTEYRVSLNYVGQKFGTLRGRIGMALAPEIGKFIGFVARGITTEEFVFEDGETLHLQSEAHS